jgi:hypothetical protein
MRLREVLESLEEFAKSLANESQSDLLKIIECMTNIASGNFLDITIYQYFIMLLVLFGFVGTICLNVIGLKGSSLTPFRVLFIMLCITDLYLSWLSLSLFLGLIIDWIL